MDYEKKITASRKMGIEVVDGVETIVILLSSNLELGLPIKELQKLFEDYGYILKKKGN